MAHETLTVDTDGRLAVVTVTRPKALNALDATTIAELGDVFDALASDDAVGAVIITGAGDKAFVAGADISEMTDLSVDDARALSRRGQTVFHRIESLGKPVIAAINGFALGGGCELALACTVRIAAEGARLGLPEVKLGLIPGYGGTQRLPRLVGRGIALELILTGDMVDVARAAQIGLVNRVVPAAELLDSARDLASKMLSAGPLAVRSALGAVSDGADVDLAQALDIEAAAFGGLFGTDDAREGIAAFLEKRPASFTGR